MLLPMFHLAITGAINRCVTITALLKIDIGWFIFPAVGAGAGEHRTGGVIVQTQNDLVRDGWRCGRHGISILLKELGLLNKQCRVTSLFHDVKFSHHLV